MSVRRTTLHADSTQMSVTRATPVATPPQKPVGRGTQRADTSRDTIIEWPAKEEDIDKYGGGLRAMMLQLSTDLLAFHKWYLETIVPLNIPRWLELPINEHEQNILYVSALIISDSRSKGRTNITKVKARITDELDGFLEWIKNAEDDAVARARILLRVSSAGITREPLNRCKEQIKELVNHVVVLLDTLQEVVKSGEYTTLRTREKKLNRLNDLTR